MLIPNEGSPHMQTEGDVGDNDTWPGEQATKPTQSRDSASDSDASVNEVCDHAI